MLVCEHNSGLMHCFVHWLKSLQGDFLPTNGTVGDFIGGNVYSMILGSILFSLCLHSTLYHVAASLFHGSPVQQTSLLSLQLWQSVLMD